MVPRLEEHPAAITALKKSFPKALLNDQNPIIIKREEVEWT